METAQKISEFLDSAKVYYLATVEGDQPRVRPYGAQMLYDGKIYVMAFYHSNATRQLEQNPKAEICAFNGKTLRVECELIEDKTPEIKEALLKKYPELKSALGDHAENAVMYEVKNATATFYKFMEELESYKF
ncbi:MAG: NimC/NimA family protein [Bacteroides sp.]|nr:NimC/NimA family protein [Bacteroides sp.]